MAKKKERPGIMFYHDDWKLAQKMLNDNDLGFLTRAVLEYSECGTLPNNFPNDKIEVAFGFISNKVLRDIENYDEVCQKRSIAGKAGRQVAPNASTCCDCYPTVTQTVTPTAAATAEETVNITANESVTPISASHGNSRFETVQRGTDRCPPFTVKDDELPF